MIITNGRGKAYTIASKNWAVYVHDLAYEYGDYAYQVERVLRQLKKADEKNFLANLKANLKTAQSTIDALYEAAKETLLNR